MLGDHSHPVVLLSVSFWGSQRRRRRLLQRLSSRRKTGQPVLQYTHQYHWVQTKKVAGLAVRQFIQFLPILGGPISIAEEELISSIQFQFPVGLCK